MKQNKRYYHDGDGVIREVTSSITTLRKDKLNQSKHKETNEHENKSKKDR